MRALDYSLGLFPWEVPIGKVLPSRCAETSVGMLQPLCWGAFYSLIIRVGLFDNLDERLVCLQRSCRPDGVRSAGSVQGACGVMKSLTLVLLAYPPLQLLQPPHVLLDMALEVDRYQQPLAPVRNDLEVTGKSSPLSRVREAVRADDHLFERGGVLHLLGEAGISCLLDLLYAIGYGLEGLALCCFVPVQQAGLVVAYEEA